MQLCCKKKSFTLEDHVGGDVKQDVSPKFQGQATVEKVVPFQVAQHVRDRFEKTLHGNPNLHVRLVFHGTSTYNYPSIKQHGLVVPGLRKGVRVVNGSAYGVGIYLSTCPRLSLSYVRDDRKMLVCAVLVGDSNVTNHGNIFVAKDASYVLPCHVIHYTGHNPSSSSIGHRQTLAATSRFIDNAARIWKSVTWFMTIGLILSWLTAALTFVFLPSAELTYQLSRWIAPYFCTYFSMHVSGFWYFCLGLYYGFYYFVFYGLYGAIFYVLYPLVLFVGYTLYYLVYWAFVVVETVFTYVLHLFLNFFYVADFFRGTLGLVSNMFGGSSSYNGMALL